MIDAQQIDLPQGVADAIDPPGVASFSIPFPVVDRVCPELPAGGKGVGWHTGHVGQLDLHVDAKELAVGPDVGAIVGHEDRQIADDRNAVCWPA